MKTLKPVLLFIVLTSVFISCKKDDAPSPVNNDDVLPAPISNFVSQSMIDSLRAAGATINDGTTPPAINGIYLMTPDSCIYDNNNPASVGSLFSDYKFQFTNQDNAAYTLDVAQKAIPSGAVSSTPVYSFISGNGNKFSVFIIRTTTLSGVPVQQFNVLSGTVAAGGIQGFQNTLYMRSKEGDETNTLTVPAGTIRVFVTGAPGLATTSASF